MTFEQFLNEKQLANERHMKIVAEKLNGREYGYELTDEEAEQLKSVGLVVAYGYSDDNIEFRGAYEEEIGYWEKAEINFVDGEVLCYPCGQYEYCRLWKKEVAKAKRITANFTDFGLVFATDIPHEKFVIMEDDKPYGEGIVFAYEDIGGKKTPDEIKKGLDCCADGNIVCAGNCVFDDDIKLGFPDCVKLLMTNALVYIQQLESDKQQLEGMCNHMNQLRDAAAGRALKMEERVRQLETERDAAVALIPRACVYCKWYGLKQGGFFPDCKNPNGCRNVSGINTGTFTCWQWRGVQKEE